MIREAIFLAFLEKKHALKARVNKLFNLYTKKSICSYCHAENNKALKKRALFQRF